MYEQEIRKTSILFFRLKVVDGNVSRHYSITEVTVTFEEIMKVFGVCVESEEDRPEQHRWVHL